MMVMPRIESTQSVVTSQRRTWQSRVVTALAVVFFAIPLSSAVQPEQQRIDPLVFQDLDGREVRLRGEQDSTVIVIFGELYHKKTAQACEELLLIQADPRFARTPPQLVLVVSQDLPAAELKTKASQGNFPKVIVQDKQRRAFGAFRVVVMPTVAVIGRDGSTIHSMPGFSTRLTDIVTAAVMQSESRLSSEGFQDVLHPAAEPEQNHEELRAARLTHLADQLHQRHLDDLAQQRYEEALDLLPTYLDAQIGLGNLFLSRSQLLEAEKQFAKALDLQPDSTPAALGMAFVQAFRGGDQVEKAQTTANEILATQPKNPKAHYLLGLLAEQAREYEEAAMRYRKAADLLMGQRSLTRDD